MDLVEIHGDDSVFERHFHACYREHSEKWEDWHVRILPLLLRYDVPARPITAEEAREAFDYVVARCEHRPFGRNRWRGLLMMADHLASALDDRTGAVLPRLFLLPGLHPFDDRAERADAALYPLAKKDVSSPRPHTLAIAPTGAGKTDFLLRRCRRRVFYILPFQASINAMYLRIDRELNGEGDQRRPPESSVDIRRVHSASTVELEGVPEEAILQRHPGASIKVMTPHQIASLIFGTSGHEAMALDLANQDVILDEIHVYNAQAQAMVLELVRALVRLNARVHIGSATIPGALAAEIVHRLGGEGHVHTVRLTEGELNTYDRHVVRKLADEEAARDWVKRAVASGKRVLFISNRVRTAQERFDWVQKQFPNVPVLLIHSRFRRKDRVDQEQRIAEFERAAGPCVVCATQVVEVSLDISFDTLVSDTAPLDSLIQRFGRVNRRRLSAGGVLADVAVIAPPQDERSARPYDLAVLQRTFAVLSDGAILREAALQQTIDQVYPDVNIHAIDEHLVESDRGFHLRALCHHPNSLLVDALEIDSICCVRESDRPAYETSRGAERLALEIPVNWSAVQGRIRTWPQSEAGHRPFIVPDALYSETRGLTLEGSDDVHDAHRQAAGGSGQSAGRGGSHDSPFL